MTFSMPSDVHDDSVSGAAVNTIPVQEQIGQDAEMLGSLGLEHARFQHNAIVVERYEPAIKQAVERNGE